MLETVSQAREAGSRLLGASSSGEIAFGRIYANPDEFRCRFYYLPKKAQHSFPKIGWGVGGGQRPFGSFPKIHRIWSKRSSLSQRDCVSIVFNYFCSVVCLGVEQILAILAEFTGISFLNRRQTLQLFLWFGIGMIWSPHSKIFNSLLYNGKSFQ